MSRQQLEQELANTKQSVRQKKVTTIEDKLLSNITRIAVDVSFAITMGIAGLAQKSATSLWPITRAACTMNARNYLETARGYILQQ